MVIELQQARVRIGDVVGLLKSCQKKILKVRNHKEYDPEDSELRMLNVESVEDVSTKATFFAELDGATAHR
jgi:hypothetical protein